MMACEKPTETYPNTSRGRPKQLELAGHGNFCCIPLCKNSTLDKDKNKTEIGLFSFPSEEGLRRQWIKVISRYRRKGGDDAFTITKNTKVYEFHFPINNLKIGYGMGKKTLVPGSLPSIFKFKESTAKRGRKSPTKRDFIGAQFEEHGDELGEGQSDFNIVSPETDISHEDGCVSCTSYKEEIQRLRSENERLQKENDDIKSELSSAKEELTRCEAKLYNFEKLSREPAMFKSATGLEVDSFIYLYNFLNPGENSANLKYYERAKEMGRLNVSDAAETSTDGNKSGPKPKTSPKDQLFLCMSWLKNGFSLSHIVWLFNIPKSTVS